ncbi:hypothetical protein DB771_18075 [Burkholderia sp. AU29985]|nr:hypothetical protein AK34_5161 [Burkholderia dolosa AU0158]AKE01968.1 hypothetical protein XM57_02735 [Burkholderia cepacia]AYZ95606.1 hypothetical protein EGY28_10400 [Burkholderia dolosa]ETP61773.1 hypothetical protein BDSB_28935 [Burkholderia dolosa PC543]PRE51060.1 hypothetical protein C6P87_11315 [Burkholderia sp. AU12872]PUA75418.1 hypothetical protein DB771_18075 [Burkholderia sp. AU29985]
MSVCVYWGDDAFTASCGDVTDMCVGDGRRISMHEIALLILRTMNGANAGRVDGASALRQDRAMDAVRALEDAQMRVLVARCSRSETRVTVAVRAAEAGGRMPLIVTQSHGYRCMSRRS